VDKLTAELQEIARQKSIKLTEGEGQIDDVLTYALFPQVGLKFLENRDNPAAFEPVPTGNEAGTVKSDAGEEIYTVEVEGQSYTVTVNNGGDITGIVPPAGGGATSAAATPAAAGGEGEPFPAPLAGNIFKVLVEPGDEVEEGETMIILEAMKMETSISAPRNCVIATVLAKEGDAVAVGDTLVTLA
jgi:oxaloacetate decarboxylase alpha subunit